MTTEDLISVLDRVLDKGIVCPSFARITFQGDQLVSVDARLTASRVAVEMAAIYAGYAESGAWLEINELKRMFPYWRKDRWTQ